MDAFVFSMSNDGGDVLSQWCAYAQPGDRYAIAGGADDPSNLQWQTVEEGTAKDKVERVGCHP